MTITWISRSPRLPGTEGASPRAPSSPQSPLSPTQAFATRRAAPPGSDELVLDVLPDRRWHRLMRALARRQLRASGQGAEGKHGKHGKRGEVTVSFLLRGRSDGVRQAVVLEAVPHEGGGFDLLMFVPAKVRAGATLGEWRIKSVAPCTREGVAGTRCLVADPDAGDDGGPPGGSPAGAALPTLRPQYVGAAVPRLERRFDFLDVTGQALRPLPLPRPGAIVLGPEPAPARRDGGCAR